MTLPPPFQGGSKIGIVPLATVVFVSQMTGMDETVGAIVCWASALPSRLVSNTAVRKKDLFITAH